MYTKRIITIKHLLHAQWMVESPKKSPSVQNRKYNAVWQVCNPRGELGEDFRGEIRQSTIVYGRGRCDDCGGVALRPSALAQIPRRTRRFTPFLGRDIIISQVPRAQSLVPFYLLAIPHLCRPGKPFTEALIVIDFRDLGGGLGISALGKFFEPLRALAGARRLDRPFSLVLLRVHLIELLECKRFKYTPGRCPTVDFLDTVLVGFCVAIALSRGLPPHTVVFSPNAVHFSLVYALCALLAQYILLIMVRRRLGRLWRLENHVLLLMGGRRVGFAHLVQRVPYTLRVAFLPRFMDQGSDWAL
mmetsp:Transcript_22986/g.36119  ORF Transcript_22986/g.36119 Transcript_22986/m.36119 type:complete len:302 (+) Transcript_22986:2490-3395(+)